MRLPAFVLALLTLLPTLAAAQPALSVQEALLRAKPAVALVVSEVAGDVVVRCGDGAETKVTPPPFRETGTAWFISPSGWLITNAHVVSPAHRPPDWLAREQTARAVNQTCGTTPGTGRATLEPSISVFLSNGVKFPAAVVKYSPPVAGEAMSGQDLALLKLEAADMPTLSLGDSAALHLGDKMHIIGFPDVVLSHELLNSSAKMEASITSGAVSGFKTDRTNQPVIQTDASAAWGNSGGPAVDESGAVVGVVTFVSLSSDRQGSIVQGFNFVIPSAAVVKFLQDTPVPRGEASRFNAVWYAGLRDHFAGNYRRARAELNEANRLLPELPDVRRITADNDALYARQPLLPWTKVGVAMLVVSAAGEAALLLRRRQRNRFRIRPTEVMQLIEGSDPPVILDVRAGDEYARSPMRIPKSVHLPLDALGTDAAVPIDLARVIVAYCT
ncbi:MAG TPA: trypsin-like peptidase domain-containing protein [Methylomirabilota bacterium]|nr:trypsin-like peptidase domain-containing protein [Methylomirabilota bacterium]